VLDGTPSAARRASAMLAWDVSNGVARRAWSGNHNARTTIARTAKVTPGLNVTKANLVEDDLLLELLAKKC